jgi:toxin ParE1/3/4
MKSGWHIQITGQAESNLREIYEYIALTLLEPGIAIKQIRRNKKKISKLEVSPQSYAVYPKEPWRSRGLRRVNAGNYAIFFVPDERKKTVAVIRIMYGGRDIERILDDADLIED